MIAHSVFLDADITKGKVARIKEEQNRRTMLPVRLREGVAGLKIHCEV